MLWAFVLAVALAIVFVKLGAYSVWMGIAAAALKIALVALAVLSGTLLWWRVAAKRKGSSA